MCSMFILGPTVCNNLQSLYDIQLSELHNVSYLKNHNCKKRKEGTLILLSQSQNLNDAAKICIGPTHLLYAMAYVLFHSYPTTAVLHIIH